MHTAAYRANALLTYASTALAILAALASLTDLWHKSSPVAQVKLVKTERLHVLENHLGGRDDEAYLAFSLQADLRSTFSWNTKLLFVYLLAEYETPTNALNQVSLWDRIVQEREEAQFTLPFVRNKYPLLDQGQHLRGLAANLTLYWNVMPIVGRLYTGHMTFPNALSLPAEYTMQHGAGLGAQTRVHPGL